MRKRLGPEKNKKQVRSILLIYLVIAASMVVVFPLTVPEVKAQVVHLATASLEDAAGMPYDTGPLGDGIVEWDPNVDHIINNPLGYTIESFMTLNIPPLNTNRNKPDLSDPDQHEIVANRIDVFGKFITNQDGVLLPHTKTGFLGGGMIAFDGIYFHPGSEGRLFDVLIKDAENGVVFLPGSKLIFPGVQDTIFRDTHNYGMYMDGALGYTNMEMAYFEFPNEIGLYVTNGTLNLTYPVYFKSHGPGSSSLHISNAKVSADQIFFWGYNQTGNSIFIEGDSDETVISECLFKDGNETEDDNYYIQCQGSSILIDNCIFVTRQGARTVRASDDAF